MTDSERLALAKDTLNAALEAIDALDPVIKLASIRMGGMDPLDSENRAVIMRFWAQLEKWEAANV